MHYYNIVFRFNLTIKIELKKVKLVSEAIYVSNHLTVFFLPIKKETNKNII